MRRCLRCGTEIAECMGFILARDMLAAMDGHIPWTSVREHCGMCADRADDAYLRSIPDLVHVEA